MTDQTIFDAIRSDREAGTDDLDTQQLRVGVEPAFANVRRKSDDRVRQLEEIALAAEELANSLEAQESAIEAWCDTLPYSDEKGEAESAKAEEYLRACEDRTEVKLVAFRKAAGGE